MVTHAVIKNIEHDPFHAEVIENPLRSTSTTIGDVLMPSGQYTYLIIIGWLSATILKV